jgi:hypothetical protein
MKGFIKTHGNKAVTIQTENKTQYYAPIYELEYIIIQILNTKACINVTFDEDRTKYSGHSNGKARYYANNVQLCHIIY